EPEPALAVHERVGLVQAVEVGAAEHARLALVEVAAQPEVAVGEREDRLGLRQQVRAQARLAHAPGLGREGLEVDRHVVLASSSTMSSARSSTTMSAPCARSASAWPTRLTPTTQPKPPARPASTPASASSSTAAAGGSTPS